MPLERNEDERKFRVSPKLLCLSIDEVDTQGNNFNVIYRKPCVPFSKKDLNENASAVVITSEVAADTLTFFVMLY